jgi:16S rRNA G1207 methylase RsmC
VAANPTEAARRILAEVDKLDDSEGAALIAVLTEVRDEASVVLAELREALAIASSVLAPGTKQSRAVRANERLQDVAESSASKARSTEGTE